MKRSILAIVLVALLSPSLASAGGGEHMLTLRPEYSWSGAHGAGISAGYQWGIDDWWNLWAEVGWVNVAEQFPDRAKPVYHEVYSNAGVVFNIDAFEWVPYLVLSFGAAGAIPSEGESTAVFRLAAGGGLDYRPTRNWGVGLFAHYHVSLAGEGAPNRLSAGARINWYF